MKTVSNFITMAKVKGEWVGIAYNPNYPYNEIFVSCDGLNESRDRDFFDTVQEIRRFRSEDLLMKHPIRYMNPAMTAFLAGCNYISPEEERKLSEEEERNARIASYANYTN